MTEESYEDSLDGKFRMIISHRQMGYADDQPADEFNEMLDDLVKAASPKWISVKDEMPEYDKHYDSKHYLWYDGQEVFCQRNLDRSPHWMPLPSPPKPPVAS